MAGEIQLNSVTLATESGGVASINSSVNIKGPLNASGSAPIYACRAWVNFNGTGTVAIRSSGNVSSVTDNGTGNYTVNFTTAMPDVNYCVTGSAGYGSGGAGRYFSTPTGNGFTSDFLTASVRLNTVYAYNALQDCEVVNVAIFR